MSTPLLRRANPDDATFIAWGMVEASRGWFTTIFGPRVSEFLATAIAQQTHSFSYEHSVIAKLDGEAVGLCHSFPPGTPDGTPAAVSACRQASGALVSLRAGIVAFMARPFLSAVGKREAGQWYVEMFAVKPEARSRGVGSLLFSDAFEQARKENCHSLALDVDTTNTRAEALYHRLGLEIVTTSSPAWLLGGLSAHRMVAKLDEEENRVDCSS